MESAGINFREENDADHIFGMTNEQVKDVTGTRKIEHGRTFAAETLKPIPGGLFDPEATGSLTGGERAAYIELPEPMPNPVMLNPLRAILQMTNKEFDEVMSGEKDVNGKQGGEAMKELLSGVNLNSVIKDAKEEIQHGAKSKRDAAVKRYRYAMAMKANKTRPEDFMMDRVTVLPPKYRPISKQGSLTMVNDMNHMYKALLESIEDYSGSKDLPDDIRNAARMNVYDTYKAVVGVADPTQAKLQQKNIGGIFKQLFGSGSAKNSFVQRRVIGGDIDLSGLAVITPNPALKLNQAGLPEKKAWELYEPFVVRQLIQKGMPATHAAKSVEKRDGLAYTALQEVVKQRPVILNRAPTLHKYSMMAFWPVLSKGDTLQISPSIVKPYSADFDGNCTDFDSTVRVRIPKSALDEFLKCAILLIEARNMAESTETHTERKTS
jgi:DNA-directed RNA polymerase subunit beta'